MNRNPFASSEVEMPIMQSLPMGVSTTLDTNGEGWRINLRWDPSVASRHLPVSGRV